jgi:hypothetical protein
MREKITYAISYNDELKRYEFDNKLYLKDNIWYWLHTNECCRPVDLWEENYINKHIEKLVDRN